MFYVKAYAIVVKLFTGITGTSTNNYSFGTTKFLIMLSKKLITSQIFVEGTGFININLVIESITTIR